MGAIKINMEGISFEKGRELLTNFPCSQCQLYLTKQDIRKENYSFWFSDYANEIIKEGSFYGANFWLKGIDHLECPDMETCEGCYQKFSFTDLKELNYGFYCEPCYQELKSKDHDK